MLLVPLVGSSLFTLRDYFEKQRMHVCRMKNASRACPNESDSVKWARDASKLTGKFEGKPYICPKMKGKFSFQVASNILGSFTAFGLVGGQKRPK